jgi:hypothetical protein
MFDCERCGSSFNPRRAATLASCPRCQARDGVVAPLSFRLFAAAGPAADGAGPASAAAEQLVEGAATEHRSRLFGDHV